MEINADFKKPVALRAEEMEWVASPMPGVSRRMLDRIGGEVARATSIVRYAPGSDFSAHLHEGGEEFFVLDGIFQDEHGDYPAGTYVRNPPLSRHKPGSEPGCTIFVKLWQFDPADRSHVRIDMTKLGAVPDAARAGVRVSPLFQDARENVRVETWEPGARVNIAAEGGLEVFVLAGGLEHEGRSYGLHSWLRVPDGAAPFSALAGKGEGVRLWVKSGHLVHAAAPKPSRLNFDTPEAPETASATIVGFKKAD
jgi:hypothetical protein